MLQEKLYWKMDRGKTPEGVREIPFDFFVTNSVLATEALTNSEANADKVKRAR